ncbi:transposase [Pseudomonas lini]
MFSTSKYVDTIALIVRVAIRQRTSYPQPFKAQVLQECLQSGVSMARVALRHGINANLVRKCMPAYRDRQVPALPAFFPMKLESKAQPEQQMSVSIDAFWLATELTDMRPGTETALAK